MRTQWKQRPVFRFFLLYFFMLVLQQGITLSDSFFVGNILGTAQFAAVDASVALLRLPVAFAAGLSSGITIVLSQALGEKKTTGGIALSGVMLCALFGMVIAYVGFQFSTPLLSVYSVPKALLEPATLYYCLRLIGIPFSLTFSGCIGIMYAKEKVGKPLLLLLLSFVLNLALTYLFVAKLHWKVTGAAVATVLSQVLLCAVSMWLCYRDGEFSVASAKELGRLGKLIMKTGLPIALQAVTFALTNTVLYRYVNQLGTVDLAAWGLCGKLDTPFWLVLDAAGLTLTTFCAKHYGSGQLQGLKHLLRKGGMVCLLGEAILCGFLWLLSPFVGGWFLKDAPVVNTAVQVLRILLLFYLPYALADLTSAGLRACGKTMLPFLFVLLQCALRLVALLFVSPTELKDVVICYCLSLAAFSLCAVPEFLLLRNICNKRKRS